MCAHLILYCCIHKVDALDESLAIDKLALCKTHAYTMDTHLENFDSLTNKYKTMLEE